MKKIEYEGINRDGKKIYIHRDTYINTLNEYKDKNTIKILCGMRRTGKSEILKQFHNYLIDQGEKNLIYISFEEPELCDFSNHIEFLNHINKRIVKNQHNYIFLDEIQKLDKFEIALNSLHKKTNIDVYITGSNSKLYSTELATLLTGRSTTILINPLSYQEYYKAMKPITNWSDDALWNDYFKYGGLPGRLEYIEEYKIFKYIDDVFNDIIINDIQVRHSIKNITIFKSFNKFILHNIAKRISLKKITNILNEEYGYKSNTNLLARYLEYLIEALVINKLEYYSNNSNQILKTAARYYATDHGMRNVILLNKIKNSGRVLENIMYNQFKNENYNIKGLLLDNIRNESNNKEIDFVLSKVDDSFNVQITEYLNEENENSELGNFNYVKNHNLNFLFCLNKTTYKTENAKLINIIEYLLGNTKLK